MDEMISEKIINLEAAVILLATRLMRLEPYEEGRQLLRDIIIDIGSDFDWERFSELC